MLAGMKLHLTEVLSCKDQWMMLGTDRHCKNFVLFS